MIKKDHSNPEYDTCDEDKPNQIHNGYFSIDKKVK